MSYSKTYPILHHGFVDVPPSHQGWNWPHADYFATSIFACFECGYLPSNASKQSSFYYPLLLYHSLFTFLSCFSVLHFQPVAIFWTPRHDFNPKALRAGYVASKWCWDEFVYKRFAVPSSVVSHCYILIHTYIIRMNSGFATGPFPQRYSLYPTQNGRWLLIYQFNLIFHIWPASSILVFLRDQVNSTLPCQSTNFLV